MKTQILGLILQTDLFYYLKRTSGCIEACLIARKVYLLHIIQHTSTCDNEFLVKLAVHIWIYI